MAVDQLSRAFLALADPTRRAMVSRLAAGDATLSELARDHDISVQAVAKHLNLLEEAALVTRQQGGYRKPAHLEIHTFDLLSVWLERHRRQAEERYGRLDELLEAMPETPPTRTNRGGAR